MPCYIAIVNRIEFDFHEEVTMYRITNGNTMKYDGYLATAIMAALAMGLGSFVSV